MNRDELGIALLLSVPVAVGVAAAVMKTTAGRELLLSAVSAIVAGGLVFGLVVAAVSRRPAHGETPIGDRLSALAPGPQEATTVDLLLGASLGAIVTVFLWYIPLAPVLGGAVAGALQGGSRRDATRAGLLAGVLVPFVVLWFAIGAFMLAGTQVFGRFPFGPTAAVAASIAGVVYTVVCSTVGGRIGGEYLTEDRRWGQEV